MNRIDELIKELCPDGVAYVKIEEITDYEQPTKYIVKSTNYNDAYKTPVLTAGQTFILGYTNETDGIFEATLEHPIIIFDDFTGAFKWVNFPFKVKSSAMKIITVNNKMSLRYLYHVMGHLNFTSEEHKRLWIGTYSQFGIPLPPLAIQEEIVRILDEYSEKNEKLIKKLYAEIDLRKKQYAYYRDMLLDFGSVHGKETHECKWRTLGEVIISLNTGLNPRKFFKLNTEDATNYYITIREIRNGKITPNNKTDRINNNALQLCNNRSNLEVGDVLFSGTGTVGETAVITKKPTNWNIKEGVYSIKPIQTKILPFFLYYILQTEKIKTAYMKKVAGGTVKSIPMVEMKKILIPVPSLEEQKRIVGILDRFDRLCNDLTSGLPAEINARKKQYAYYRDKLLSFQRKEL
ncbi:MAG: restriction endonuclease subunit S [Oscillospiraceae bacterium]|nr:restriction endonuclease subunit S [Oscillospiraceae bacterium]